MTLAPRLALAQEYWTNAQRALGQGESGKAAELTWGFVAQLLKRASAGLLNFDAREHRDLFTAAKRFTAMTGDPYYTRTVGQLGELHRNFYEGELDGDTVRMYAGDAWLFGVRLEELIATTASGLPPTGDGQSPRGGKA